MLIRYRKLLYTIITTCLILNCSIVIAIEANIEQSNNNETPHIQEKLLTVITVYEFPIMKYDSPYILSKVNKEDSISQVCIEDLLAAYNSAVNQYDEKWQLSLMNEQLKEKHFEKSPVEKRNWREVKKDFDQKYPNAKVILTNRIGIGENKIIVAAIVLESTNDEVILKTHYTIEWKSGKWFVAKTPETPYMNALKMEFIFGEEGIIKKHELMPSRTKKPSRYSWNVLKGKGWQVKSLPLKIPVLTKHPSVKPLKFSSYQLDSLKGEGWQIDQNTLKKDFFLKDAILRFELKKEYKYYVKEQRSRIYITKNFVPIELDRISSSTELAVNLLIAKKRGNIELYKNYLSPEVKASFKIKEPSGFSGISKKTTYNIKNAIIELGKHIYIDQYEIIQYTLLDTQTNNTLLSGQLFIQQNNQGQWILVEPPEELSHFDFSEDIKTIERLGINTNSISS